MYKYFKFMKVDFLFFVFIFCFPSLVFSWEGKVSEVINGNTFRVISENKEAKKVRLYGIDVPGGSGPYEEKAMNFIHKIASLNKIYLLPYENCQSKSIEAIAYTLRSNTCINEKLILQGLATVDKEHCDKSIYNTWKLMEQQAKEKNIGLWSSYSKSNDPKIPYRWKRGRKERLKKIKKLNFKQIYVVDKVRYFMCREKIIID